MIPLPLFALLVIVSISALACTGLPINRLKSGNSPTFPPTHRTTGSQSAAIETPFLKLFRELLNLIKNNQPELLLIAAMLSICLVYRLRPGDQKQKTKLDEDDIAIITLASDTLSDFLYRVRSRSKATIIPFPRER